MYAFNAKAIRISRAKFHCSKLTTVQYIYNYASLIFGGHSLEKILDPRARGKNDASLPALQIYLLPRLNSAENNMSPAIIVTAR